MDNENVWLELPTIVQIPLHVKEVDELVEMFEHSDGWKVLAKILRREASRAGSDALDPHIDESMRHDRLVEFTCMIWLLQLSEAIKLASVSEAPKKQEDLQLPMDNKTLLDLIFEKSS